MTRRRSTIPALVAGATAILSGVAAAQPAPETPVVEGRGYPVGEGTVVHPVLGAELGVINNVFYEESESSPYTSGIFRLVAEAALASKEIEPEPEIDPLLDPEAEPAAEPAAPKMEYRAGGRIDYSEYLAPADYVRAQRTIGANLRGDLVLAPQGTFAFEAHEHFVRDTRPTNFESVGDNNRVANNLSLAVRFQPGGRQIKASLGWDNQIDYFDSTPHAGRMINSLRAHGDWHWLPFTRLYADFNWGFVGGFAAEQLAGMDYKRSAMPIRGGVGIATAITEVFTVKAHLGWAYASYSGGSGYNRPVLGAELGFRYSPLGRVVIAYDWDHRDSINADFYQDHALTARVDHAFGPKIIANATWDLRLRSYSGISPAIGPPTRSDILMTVGAGATYVLKDWLGIVANYRTEVDKTDYMVTSVPDDPSYTRHEITAGVRAAL